MPIPIGKPDQRRYKLELQGLQRLRTALSLDTELDNETLEPLLLHIDSLVHGLTKILRGMPEETKPSKKTKI